MNDGGTPSRIRTRAVSIGLVAVLHCFLLLAFFNLRWSPILMPTQREIEIYLQLPAAPLRLSLPNLPLRHLKLLVPVPLNAVTLESLQETIHELSKPPTVPFALPDIANLHPGWHYNGEDERRFLLNEPKPDHKWTATEINLYTMRTADPCMVDRSAGLPFCIDTIINGPYTIPDGTTAKPPGFSIMGISIFDGH